VAFNTFDGLNDTGGCGINNRHGLDNQFIANWVEGGGVAASDLRTRVIGNVLRSSNGWDSGLNAKAGNVTPANYSLTVQGQYVSAENSVFIGNDADVFTLGWCNTSSCPV